jgi:hypothetical protein
MKHIQFSACPEDFLLDIEPDQYSEFSRAPEIPQWDRTTNDRTLGHLIGNAPVMQRPIASNLNSRHCLIRSSTWSTGRRSDSGKRRLYLFQ